MKPKAETRPQPDGSGLIPAMLFVWLSWVTLYGIVWIGAGCCEVLIDIVNGAMEFVLGG